MSTIINFHGGPLDGPQEFPDVFCFFGEFTFEGKIYFPFWATKGDRETVYFVDDVISNAYWIHWDFPIP